MRGTTRETIYQYGPESHPSPENGHRTGHAIPRGRRALFRDPGNAKVAQEGLPFREQDVLRLDVAMHHACRCA
jgi:hypothetical protein